MASDTLTPFPQPPPRAPTPARLPRPASAASSGGGGDLLCAVCLDAIPLPALATLPGCDHAYCAPCILAWAVAATANNPVAGGGAAAGDAAPCPQCKAPFTSVVTHRRLDGSLTEEPAEESVCLLVRARWFVEGRADAAATPDVRGKAAAAPSAQHWSDDDDYDDDEEDYYFSAAAGRARVVLGNRRFGDGGVLAAGRMRARPAATARGKAGGKGKGKAAAGPAEAAAAASASAEKGRRARRAEKRASGPPARAAPAVAAAGSASCA